MSLDIVLLTPRRRFIANRCGLGYQVPLGMVFLAGPLIDAGHRVRLIDNDVLGLRDERLAREVARLRPDCVLLGHTGSTAAHPACARAARALKRQLPSTTVVYGGVYPSYHAETVLTECPEIDVVVRGEGEETAVELASVLADGGSGLGEVRGITWRDGEDVVVNPARPPIADLDRFRPGWEVVDWPSYSLFGIGRAAGMQLSRGCPHRCTFCGQWSFWRRWRHRSPENVVSQLDLLATRYGVRVVWFADENFAADSDVALEVIERLAERRLHLSLNLNMTAADVIRDAALIPLYKSAGVDNIVLGIEALDDSTSGKLGKDNSVDTSREAVRVLRRSWIVSLVNIIYGLEEESPATLRRTFRRLLQLDPDVLNAVYITPHSWTASGRLTSPDRVIQTDLARYTYRNQVLATPRLSPQRLFWSVKLTEAFFHLRPSALLRLLAAPDRRFRRILRAYTTAGAGVVFAEILEFLLNTRFVNPGTVDHVPGFPQRAPRCRATQSEPNVAKTLAGGAPQMDRFDMKPDGPPEVGGEFCPIPPTTSTRPLTADRVEWCSPVSKAETRSPECCERQLGSESRSSCPSPFSPVRDRWRVFDST